MTLSALGIFSAAGAGGVPLLPSDFELITTTIFSSTTAAITFDTSALSAYRHLQVRYVSRNASDTNGLIGVTYNGSSSTYQYHRLRGNGSTVSTAEGSSIYMEVYGSGSGAGANEFGAGVIDILDFNSTSKRKTMRALVGMRDSAGSMSEIDLMSGAHYLNTNALTSLTLTQTFGTGFISGSRFSLYGLK
jgi:hypothetical protein